MNIFSKSSLTIITGFLIIVFVTYYLAMNYGDINKYQSISSSENTNYDKSERSSPELQIAYTYKKIYEMKEGETFSQILGKTKLNDNEIQNIIKLTEEKIDLKKLNIGVKIETLSILKNDKPYVKNIIIYPDKENEIFIFRNNNNFEIKSNKLKLFSDLVYREVDIQNSIFESLIKVNTPENIIMEFVQLFSFDIDFQREIREGNKIKVFYEEFNDQKQNFIKSGEIYFAEIQLHNHSYELYRFENKNKNLVGYFDSKGKSATKALMKTPINGARLSSGYGMRKHPILGYNKKHQGVDFAAPTGTPIMAAGTGHIEYVGNNGGAGKYIRIKHLNGYKTAYAHLSKYASGISKNVKVNQGQTIGYVGSTGLSTGPHLHYEVWFNGERINPMTMKLPSGKKLENEELVSFLKLKEEIDIKLNIKPLN
tara:strand:- start:2369 stop:3643 length:1275 start_codon:yes stop_codon:yes gene_type:complete